MLALCLPLGLMACGTADTDNNQNPTPSPAPVAVTLSALTVSPDVVAVAAGLTLQLSAEGSYSDGTKKDLTAEVEWESSDTAIATISNEDGSRGLLRGLAQGTVTVRVKKGELTGERPGTIDAARLTAIALEGAMADEQLARGGTRQLVAKGTFTDDSTRELTTDLVWSSSDPAIATVSATGLVTTLAVGPVTISVAQGDLRASVALNVACVYPGTPTASIIKGGIMPQLKWAAARNPDGSPFEFDLSNVYCGSQFGDAKVIFFVVGAGWCPNCPRVVTATNRIATQIQDAGGLLVYVEMQDTNYDPTDSANATAYIDRLVGPNAPGIRVGDTDIARPANLPFNRSPEIEAIPFIMAVRISDMKYITDDGDFSGSFPFVAIAQNPDMYDRTMPPAMCMEGTEEAGEPNDTSEQPTSIALSTPLAGGICATAPDYFWIDTDGPWRATLNFTNNVGDLDMYVWDTFTDRPLSSRGQVVGSSGNGDTETIEWQGQAILRVEGYQGGQGPYTLTVAPR